MKAPRPTKNPIHEIRFPKFPYRTLPECFRAELQKISSSGFKREHAVTYDVGREKELSFGTGGREAVLCKIELPKEAQQGEIALFHNHPDEIPPSATDVAAFLTSDKIGTSTVITPKGTVYELTKTVRTPINPPLNEILGVEKRAYDKFWKNKPAWMIFAPDEDILRGSLEELAKKYKFNVKETKKK